MSSSSDGWFKLTSTLPLVSGWLKASSVCAPLGSLSSSLVSLTLVSGSPPLELEWITSAERLEKLSNRVHMRTTLRSAVGENTD